MDALEQEAETIIVDAIGKIIDVFQRIRSFQDRVSRELPYLPPGVDTLRPIDAALLRLINKTVLIDLSGNQVWQPANSFAAAAIAAMSFPSHVAGISGVIGPGWELPEVRAQFEANRARERAKQDAHLAEMNPATRGAAEPRRTRTGVAALRIVDVPSERSCRQPYEKSTPQASEAAWTRVLRWSRLSE